MLGMRDDVRASSCEEMFTSRQGASHGCDAVLLATGFATARQGGDGVGGGGGEVGRGWEGMESYWLVVIGNGTGDDGRASVEGLLYCGEDEDVEGAVL
jgi:hypothetical protein